ncbi:MAG: hypothetical protein ACI9QV_000397 [Methylophagaceae bacterium]|jgi:hypothetical protein
MVDWQSRHAGLMAKCNRADVSNLNIGDCMGVSETDLSPRLGTTRWLRIDNNDTVEIGLQRHLGSLCAICLSLNGKLTEEKCLYLPPVEETQQQETMIIGKSGYSNNRIFRVKDTEKTYTIGWQKLHYYSLTCEPFN